MLFHSQIFLLLFLPLTLAVYYRLATSQNARLWILILASFIFYGYWDIRLLPLLVFSICLNWLISILFNRLGLWLIVLGIISNLVILGIFKYANFFVSTLSSLGLIAEDPSFNIILPLGISFFTFQQISYLVDLKRGANITYTFRDYCLYVSFFPQLIAGPIVRHNEIISQFTLSPLRDGLYERLSRGLVLLLIGLVKKCLIADELAQIADPVFSMAESGKVLGVFNSWLGILAFSLQIYFDFSAYSDMAIGIAMMFGLMLPYNFNSPYKAISIIDFWRRWHMTLSRFLRDYLYIPLGGNRFGFTRQILAISITMLLGGLWHGAAWTFVVWGGLHGIAIVVNHYWRKTGLHIPGQVSWILTFTFITVCWVMFRSADFYAAQTLILSMIGTGGFEWVFNTANTDKFWLVILGLLMAIPGPNSQEIVNKFLTPKDSYAYISGLTVTLLLLFVGGWDVEEFIYFQF